jgi:hypothetical protein
LERLGFEWYCCGPTWEDSLSELANYRKTHGHCNVPKNYNENTKLLTWVTTQRSHYRSHLNGTRSPMTPFRTQALESLGSTWEDCLSELADYRKIHGHCNVPQGYSENSRMGKWVVARRSNCMLQVKGKESPMSPFRIQALESLGFEWKPILGRGTPSLGEDKRRIHKKPAISRQGADYQLETSPSTVILRATGYHWATRPIQERDEKIGTVSPNLSRASRGN